MDLATYLIDADRMARECTRTASAVELRWAELQDAMAGCAEQDCVYGCPECRPLNVRQPRRYRHDHRCSGYAGSKRLEHGAPLVRSRICARRLAWHRAQVERDKRDKDRKALPPPKSWTE